MQRAHASIQNVVQRKGKKSYGRPKPRLEDNIKSDMQ